MHASLEILPLDQVRPGMRGTGRSVFAGSAIEDFGIEVLDVVRGTRPRGNLIIFQASGERLQHTGMIAGMSGSPVYVEGKLVGAVAFAYPFVKDPIGGITPIEEMLELSRHPLPAPADAETMESGPAGEAGGATKADARGHDRGHSATVLDGPVPLDAGSETRATGSARMFADLWLAFLRGACTDASEATPVSVAAAAGGPAKPGLAVSALPGTSAGLRPLPLPLAMAGWEQGLLDAARVATEEAGFLLTGTGGGPVGGAGTEEGGAGVPGGDGTLEPGSAVALELVGGDATVAAIGTVTALDGNRVYAFGHPLVQGGPIAVPMFTARIHAVMPSLQLSFKMGSPTRAVGGAWQDRRAGILGLMGAVPRTIPVRVTVSLPGRVDETFRYRIVRDPILSPMFLPWTVANSYQRSGWMQGETTARTDVEVHFENGRCVRRSDLVISEAPGLAVGSTATLPASLLLTNAFQPVRLDSLVVRIAAEPGHAAAEVTRLRCTPRRAAPGDTLLLEVTLQPWRRPEVTRSAQIVVRPGWKGKRLRLTAAGAGEILEIDRERAPGKWSPRDLDELLRMMEALPSAGSLLLRVTSRDAGALVRGRELPGLPRSLISAGSETGEAASMRLAAGAILEERMLETPWAISGRETAEVEITP